MDQDFFEKFYNKALRFLSFRPRSEKEVRSHFAKASRGRGKPPSEEIIELIIKKLKEQRFLDDREFTKWWIEQRTVVKPTGLRLIKIELSRKGISKEMIDEIIENRESGIMNQEEIAKRLAEKKLKTYKNLSREKIYQKLGGFLSRRGFDYDTIKDILKEVV